MANRLFDLPETKGSYQLKGITSGVEKDSFFNEKKTKTGKDMRFINFGLTYEEGKTLYVNLSGLTQENVYFACTKKDENGKYPKPEKVPWSQRFDYNRENYRLIGANIGVSKKTNDKGEMVNDKKVLTDFDACKEISSNLKDDVSLFTKGVVEFGSFRDDKNNKVRTVKLVPKQVSLCKEVDFNDAKYAAQNDFKQVIIFMGIEKEKDEDGKETGRFSVLGKVVTYNSIEDVEFFIESKDLASKLRKNLKPYYAIEVHGKIVASVLTETVEDDDTWGEEDAMSKVGASVKREFIVTGAKPSTIEKEAYAEDKVNAAIQAINNANKAESDFGSEDSWGDDDVDEEDEEW